MMMFKLLAALVLTTAATQRPAPPPNAMLGEVRMHLFYGETGRLSPDISPPNEFIGWNTIIGEGSAEENANDLLIVAELRSEGQQNVNRPLLITARVGRRVIGQRREVSALTSERGFAYVPLYLRDVGCAGEIRVEVTLGSERRTESLRLACGE